MYIHYAGEVILAATAVGHRVFTVQDSGEQVQTMVTMLDEDDDTQLPPSPPPLHQKEAEHLELLVP